MRYIIPLVTGAILGGCAAIHRPPATVATLERDAIVDRGVERATVDTLVERLARRAVARGDRTLDLLFLSGGGQHGAYGVGFLRGWMSRTDAPMPRFDLVTGISTGALQAPFALIGTQEALDTLSAVYQRAADRIAPTLDWWFWLRRTGGVVNTSRYRQTIATLFDARFRDQLSTAFREGRQLAIGTTDFDLGLGRTWDLAHEVALPDSGLARVHTLLLASSAIPGIFPPIVIDRHVHVDGGIISSVLPVLDFERYRQLGARLGELKPGGPVTVRLWVIMNIWTRAKPVVINPASRKQISGRSTLLLFSSPLPQLLPALSDLSRAVNAEVPGVRVEVRFTAVPSELATAPGADALFDRDWMRRLETLGYDRARGATPWDSLATRYARPER